jgi:uncharacterized membrane-anchored protein
VGTHDNLVEFLDKGREGMSSTFLVRLKVGPKLVDAKGVSRLYRGQLKARDLILLVGSALVAMVIVVSISAPLRAFFDSIFRWIRDFWVDLFR